MHFNLKGKKILVKNKKYVSSQLTCAGDLFASCIAGVVIELGVRVVQDGPALWMLHGITVALVMDLAAPTG